MTERQTAEIKKLPSDSDTIRLELTCKADPALYDLPLTLSTKVPADCKNGVVTQGTNSVTVPVRVGEVQYNALPDGRTITVKRSE